MAELLRRLDWIYPAQITEVHMRAKSFVFTLDNRPRHTWCDVRNGGAMPSWLLILST